MNQSHDHARSYYLASANAMPERPALAEDLSADVCVIGGGFTGVNTAIELAQRGLSVILLEARRIGWGASGRNGGQLIRGIGHDVSGFARHVGEEGVRYLQRAGIDSVALVGERIREHSIDCDLRWGFCELANTPAQFAAFKGEQQSLAALGYKPETRLVAAQDMAQVVGSERYAGGLVDMGSGHLHPLNLVLGEARVAEALGVRIFEQSPALQLIHGDTVQVRCASGTVRAANLVLACNAHLEELEPRLSGKVLPAGSYIIATEPLPAALADELIPQNLALCDQKVGLDYYRLSADRRLLFGGACHYSGRDPLDIAAYMRPKMLKVFPQLATTAIEFQWGGKIGITANRFPQVGRLQQYPNVFYAQGYSGHGLNVTHWCARLLAEAIHAGHSQGLETFSRVPHMTFPGGKALRSPLLALGMLWYRLREMLG
ncbi:NAD(P)/FAD-dependent oxidoreductase [Pseudomonas proteolytica]|uniref:FAD-dependent oxidoreductase n=1 Tax=Pseudomonas proteolytica TaxID=219574 RepID=A0AAW5AAI2_9PSED|nr:FAD-binding oxidoreductase [Pseudomonas proteolytica]TDR45346.1 gamma-glutamylputrescine oxidase [Pseudomonas brenneri]KAA8698675.1 FAD-binding oxidoreductase [Pseudomonas proteolytica]MCF5059585.1 FAD-dependent oxidoreductase [Pseudomonas proteolytica]MCF5100410.1 FAD-dependent oxidoreductase [Pseudomonas proteolytica]TWR75394.1 FAD-binding oxidoreductase [Pseudomonas proteolytica]